MTQLRGIILLLTQIHQGSRVQRLSSKFCIACCWAHWLTSDTPWSFI